MSKEIKCFLGKNNPSAICVNKADYIRLRNKIKETKIKSHNEALRKLKTLIKKYEVGNDGMGYEFWEEFEALRRKE